MKAVLIVELKGFAQQATSMALRMGILGLTDAKIRTATRSIINEAIDQINAVIPSKSVIEIGGDTWVIELGDADRAVNWGTHFYKLLESRVIQNGLFYLKPSMALAVGDIKFSGPRFMDDESINAYREADKGEPFRFCAIGEAAKLVADMKHVPSEKTDKYESILWQRRTVADLPTLGKLPISLSHLLLDNEVLYFRTHDEVLSFLQDQQVRSKEIHVYGGPAPLRFDFYRDYAQSIASLLKNNNVRCSVLNYLNEGAPQDAASWLLMCHQLQQAHEKRFSYAAYLLPPKAIKPVAYHVYDDVTVIMLRSLDEFTQTLSVSGSIIVKGSEVSSRFRGDFRESFKTIGRFDQAKYDKLMRVLRAKGANLASARKLVAEAIGAEYGKQSRQPTSGQRPQRPGRQRTKTRN